MLSGLPHNRSKAAKRSGSASGGLSGNDEVPFGVDLRLMADITGQVKGASA